MYIYNIIYVHSVHRIVVRKYIYRLGLYRSIYTRIRLVLLYLLILSYDASRRVGRGRSCGFQPLPNLFEQNHCFLNAAKIIVYRRKKSNPNENITKTPTANSYVYDIQLRLTIVVGILFRLCIQNDLPRIIVQNYFL